MAKEVKEINVLSRWGVLVVGQAKKEQQFYDLVNKTLKAREWPFPVQLAEVG